LAGGSGEFPGMTAARKKQPSLDSALALQQKGDLAGAEAAFRAVIAADPENPDALLQLGLLLQKSRRAEEALPLIEAAMAAAPKRGRRAPPAWRVALSYAKRDAGDLEGALAIVEALVREAPGVVEPLFLRAGMLQRLERDAEAIRDYEAILKQAPNDVRVLNNYGFSLKRTKRLKEAFDVFRKAMELDPRYCPAIVNVGTLMLDMGRPQAAIANLRRARALDPEDRRAEIAFIDALHVGERPEEAERVAAEAFARAPDDIDAIVQLGGVRMVMGRRDSAIELARRAHKISPRTPGVLTLLAEADREADAGALLREIEDVLCDQSGSGYTISLHFAAARLCEKLDDYPQALSHYVAGNVARKDQLERLDSGYNRAQFEAEVSELIAAFDSTKFGGAGGSTSELPIFVVGMPRSGTTLTEQILASHPLVAGAGELNQVTRIVETLRNGHGYPSNLPTATIKRHASEYLTHVGKIGKGAARVTDKMPGNFMYLGLIARMFPKARIIHCRRDPADNCLSCFAQSFRADALAWSCDLEDVAHQYCQYRRIMAHWRAVLPPGRMLEIDYEDTVADLEAQARRIVEFAGLDWDDRCLEFHKTERAVVTASREQVRNPIYKSSVGRWKRYGDGVLPLIRGLAACGCGPEAEGSGAAR